MGYLDCKTKSKAMTRSQQHVDISVLGSGRMDEGRFPQDTGLQGPKDRKEESDAYGGEHLYTLVPPSI